MNSFEFVARMWRGARAMTELQEELLGEVISLDGQGRKTTATCWATVCAGIADRFNLQVGAVRIIATVSLVLCFWLTAAIYLGATLLIREKPLIYSGQETEHHFWQRDRDDHWSPS